MNESICNNKTALQIMQMNAPTITEFVPSKDDFDTLNELTDLLYPLREFITILGAQHYPTLSLCLPLIHGLLNGTIQNIELKDKDVLAFQQNLLPLLEWRFDYILKAEIFVAATFLDFRFKKMEFITKQLERKAKIKLAKQFLTKLYTSHFSTDLNITDTSSTQLQTNQDLNKDTSLETTHESTKTQNNTRKSKSKLKIRIYNDINGLTNLYLY
jgi:hypothetical protein